MRLGSGFSLTLSEDDAAAIAAECPAVSAVAPVVRSGAQVMRGSNNWATSVYGTVPAYLEIRDAAIERGQGFTAQDVDGAAKVAVLGQTVANNLFGAENPVGIRKVGLKIGKREATQEDLGTTKTEQSRRFRALAQVKGF